jgi:hypothetical protein
VALGKGTAFGTLICGLLSFSTGHHHVLTYGYMRELIDGLKQEAPKSDLGDFATLVSKCSSGLALPTETISIQVYGK